MGKSSVINKLLNRNNLARVGNTPGKTVHVNYFNIDDKLYFVDLPGYGFAKVPKSEKERWSSLMEDFFSTPENIDLGVLIVDSRHKPTSDDIQMYEYFLNSGRPFVVVANKLDKLKKSEIDSCLSIIRNTLDMDDSAVLIPFSALNGTGKELLVAEINNIC